MAQKRDEEFFTVWQWIEFTEKLSAIKLAAISPRVQCFAESIDQNLKSTEGVLVCSSVENFKRAMTIVPSSPVEQEIRYYF